MADVKWIKFVSDFFDNRKIKQIRKMPDCDAVIVIWVQILCLAGSTNDNGLVYFSKDIPYTDEMLATEFDRSAEVIRYALSIFVKFGMIEIINDILMVSNWERYQNQVKLEILRDHAADRKREQRKNQKYIALNVSRTCPGQVADSHATELELEKEIDKEKENKYIGPFETFILNHQDFKDALNGYKEMRIMMKKKMTNRAEMLFINKLEELMLKGHDGISLIDEATSKNWLSVFEPTSFGKDKAKRNYTLPEYPTNDEAITDGERDELFQSIKQMTKENK